jgi:hypothetical protein
MYRDNIINLFIEKYNFTKYLEIGVFEGGCIKKINCDIKDGVDPGAEDIVADEVNFIMTSNEFFEQINLKDKKYDIIFIDGLHHTEQVDLDIQNSLIHSEEDGIIVLHDCSPPTINHTLVPRIQLAWNGDVYKSVLKFQMELNNHTYFTIDTDWGCGVILKNKKLWNVKTNEFYINGINKWEFFENNRKELLNLITPNEFLELLNKI